MKKLLIYSLLLFTFSCHDSLENSLKEPPEKLSTNPHFINVHNELQFALTKLNSIGAFEDEKRFLSLTKQYEESENLIELAKLWGFENKDNYVEHISTLYSEMTLLLEDFPEIGQNNSEAHALVINALSDMSIQKGSADCYDRYQTCTSVADGLLIVETAACIGSLFIPFIGPFLGPVCEAGAILIHHGMTQKCIFDYEDCHNNVN